MDDVVTPACGAGRGDGSYLSWHGQPREWEGDNLRITQFAGAFGVVTAAEAIMIAEDRLTCEEYSNTTDSSGGIPAPDPDGHHKMLGEAPVPDYPGVDKGFMFCEAVDDLNYTCTGILGREDILSRIQVVTLDRQYTEEVTLQLLGLAAKRLAEAW